VITCHPARAILIASAFVLFATGTSLAAGKVGVAAATKNSVTGSQGSRALSPGSEVFELETITTGGGASAQLLFLDETTLSIGPKASIRLDKFVFDPGRGTGSVLLSASRGAFRFISGSQDPNNYKVRTPVATIGFRGTIVDCYLTARALLCILQEGETYFEVGGKTYTIDVPGQAFAVTPGRVEGPFTPDGSLFDVSGVMAFPLWGGDLDGVIKELTSNADVQEVIDDLNSQDIDPPGGGGGGGGDGPPDDDCPVFPNCDG
jgi:hypothetical protein